MLDDLPPPPEIAREDLPLKSSVRFTPPLFYPQIKLPLSLTFLPPKSDIN